MAYSADERIKPFKMTDNIYFIGRRCASSHMIDTGDGLVIIDTGYPEMAEYLKNNIEMFGFDVLDVKYIIHSHGHIDHAGATKEFLKYAKNAVTFIGRGDKDTVEGKDDLSCSEGNGYDWSKYAFKADRIIDDGDVIELGNMRLKCVSTPGHTEGTISFFFDTSVCGKVLRAGMMGGAGVNSLRKSYLDKHCLSYTMRKKYFESMEKLKSEKVDVFIGNHAWNNNTEEKAKLIKTSCVNPFVNPGEWEKFLDMKTDELRKVISDESRELFVNYAHRGASQYAPENTMMSFYLGMAMMANGIETDVHKTKDGVLILFHDDTLERVTGAYGNVSDFTIDELLRLTVKKDELYDKIVIFEDFLKHFSFFDITFAIEIKQKEIEEEVVDMLEKYNMRDKCVITSFDFESVRRVKLYNPKYRAGYLTSEVNDEIIKSMYDADIDELCPKGCLCTAESVSKWHEMGFCVRSWGNTEENMKSVYDSGVDGMTVNFPDKLREYILSKAR